MISKETLEVLARRRSARTFGPTPPAEQTLRTLAEAGALAPYAMADPRRVIVVTNDGLLARINEAAKAQACRTDLPHLRQLGGDPAFHAMHHAKALLIVSASSLSPAPEVDCAAAAENIVIAAEALDLAACWVFFPLLALESPEADSLRHALRMEAGEVAYAAVAVGERVAEPLPPRTPEGIRYIR